VDPAAQVGPVGPAGRVAKVELEIVRPADLAGLLLEGRERVVGPGRVAEDSVLQPSR
jgi:hypothetical protein